MTEKLIFIDTETTGTDPKKHGLIQLAGMIQVGDKTETFNFNPNIFPGDEIDEQALLVNGIKQEEFIARETPKAVHVQFTSLLSKYCNKFDRRDKFHFIGYNALFDDSFIRAFFKKCGDDYYGSWFFFPPIDVMVLAASRLMNERADMKDFKLGTVAAKFGLKPRGTLHDALADIELTKDLYQFLIKEGTTNVVA